MSCHAFGLSLPLYRGIFPDDMLPRIKSFLPLDGYQLSVTFDDGCTVRYDVAEDIRAIPAFGILSTEYGLFRQAQLDTSRTCIYWDEQIETSASVAEDMPEYRKTE